MIIDNKNGIVSRDALICITFEDVLLTAQCNGTSVQEAYKNVLKIALKDANAMFAKYENNLKKAVNKRK